MDTDLEVAQGEFEGGTAIMTVEPQDTTVAPEELLSFEISITPQGKDLTNVVLNFSMDDINGVSPLSDMGLADDAVEDYGSGLFEYRPLQFELAGQGPNSSNPSTPAANAVSGGVQWNIGTLTLGFTGKATVTVRVPKGYIEDKAIGARASVTHTAAPMGTTAQTTLAVDVDAVEDYSIRTAQSTATTPPGATSVWARFGFRNGFVNMPDTMDVEDIDISVDPGAGSCVPTLVDTRIQRSPALPAGYTAALTSVGLATPVTATFDRLPFDVNEGQIYLFVQFDIPASCVDGDQVVLSATGTAYGSQMLPQSDVTIDVGNELCRNTTVRAFRTQSGNPVMDDYQPFPDPGNQDNYMFHGLGAGSARPGEFIAVTTPQSSGAIQTVVLDRTYYHYTIPEGVAFHGIRLGSFLGDTDLSIHGAYKNCSGTALPPTDPMFNHADPEDMTTGWHQVSKSWPAGPGVIFNEFPGPFEAMPDDNDPFAVAPAGCELLFVKVNDSPAGTLPDNGAWQVRGIYRICDGNFGCPIKSDLDSRINMDNGFTYTVEDVSVATPQVNTCITPSPGGHQFYVGTASYPEIDIEPSIAVVHAGDILQLDVTPGNNNLGSEYVDGRWYIDFSPDLIRNNVQLDAILGQVLTMDGATPLQWPDPDQNVTGESCPDPIAAITYNPPDSNNCNAPNDPGCLAWFEVPRACQPANGYWGAGVQQVTNEHLKYLKFRLSVPIKDDVPKGTDLDFTAQVRQSDGMTLGADNAAPTNHWPASHYSNVGTVEVLTDPDAQIFKNGPVQWPASGVLPYELVAQNVGNISLRGIYIIDQLPRTDATAPDQSDFTPIYRRVYTDRDPSNVVVESSTDANCFSTSVAVAWTPVGAMESSVAIPGYPSQTNVDVPATARCIRIHLDNGDSVAPGESLKAIAEIELPMGTPDGQQVINRALVAASDQLNGATETLTVPGETLQILTNSGNDPVVVVEKSFEIDPTRAGYIKWILRYYNASGVDVTNAIITDTLPTNTMYDGLASPLDTNETCTDGTDMDNNCLTSSGGTEVRFTIGNLTPFDGAQGSGTDEGTIEIWTVNNTGLPPNTLITNCGNAEPSTNPAQPDGCSTANTIDFTMTKSITGSPTMVNIGDTMEYVLTGVNNTTSVQYVTVYDELSVNVSYVPGTLLINGGSASDSLMQTDPMTGADLVNYTQQVQPGGTLEIKLTVQVDGPMAGGAIGNIAVGSGCTNPIVPTTCAPATASSNVVVTVPGTTCGNGMMDAGEECDDGGESATCDDDCTFVVCGDTNVNTTAMEQCDDGNMMGGDGCSSTCQIEGCGNGVVDVGEDCDDMGESATCDADCTSAMCGDGTVNMTAMEECDGMGETITCNADCTNTVCGDGTVNMTAGEACDDMGESMTCDADCSPVVCGDGTINMTAGESCEDGNTMAGDGCSAICQIEVCGNGILDVGEDCDDMGESMNCDDDCTPVMCGDGNANMTAGEQCDDGNTMDGDTCSSTCQLPGCGDGVLAAGEGCDDDNNIDGDGCTAGCLIEDTFPCNSTDPGSTGDDSCVGVCDDTDNMAPGICEPANTCGNGTVDIGEECDDGNTTDDMTCNADCTNPPVCGDGTLDAGEGCDDNNTVDGDGCTANCLIEDDNPCNDTDPGTMGNTSCDSGVCDTTGNPAPGVCETADTCGNGIVEGMEECDDGNVVDGDMCSATCTVIVTCGDGTLDGDEGCDDSNTADGDGCNMDCLIENGNPCNDGANGGLIGNSSCASEVCDQSEDDTGVCEEANVCGNGVVDVDEDCDDGNTDDGDDCPADCTDDTAVCGNGILEAGEQCDDGNTDNGDGCSATCESGIGVTGGGCSTTGGGDSGTAWLVLLALLGGVLTRRRRELDAPVA